MIVSRSFVSSQAYPAGPALLVLLFLVDSEGHPSTTVSESVVTKKWSPKVCSVCIQSLCSKSKVYIKSDHQRCIVCGGNHFSTQQKWSSKVYSVWRPLMCTIVHVGIVSVTIIINYWSKHAKYTVKQIYYAHAAAKSIFQNGYTDTASSKRYKEYTGKELDMDFESSVLQTIWTGKRTGR